MNMPHPRALFTGEALGAVVLVSAMTGALLAWACARERRAAAVALASSQGFPRQRIPAWRCHAPSVLDRPQLPGRFPAPLRDSAPSAAPAPGRWRGQSAQSVQRVAPAFRNRPMASSSRASSLRSFAWPLVTSQVPGPFSQLPAWLHRRKIAKPGWLQHQYK